MTRLDRAATLARARRALAGMGAVLVLAVAASGCIGGSPAPAPTPDPFVGLADRSDQAFREGLEAYGQGQYRDALTAFERARILSPNADPRIEQMIERSRGALAPTPTPIPPTPTSVPATPTPVPVAMSTQTPDAELGRRLFGQVTLALVPSREMDSPAATEFFFQDQVGLRIEGLKQHLRLPFSVRVFNTDTARLVAEVKSESNPSATTAVAAKTPAVAGTPSGDTVANVRALVDPATRAKAPDATPSKADSSALSAADVKLSRFWDTYVWYHEGGEEPGHYRVELYASGVLTHTFDYAVGTEPVALPEPTPAPVVEPTPGMPPVQVEPSAPPPAPYVPPRIEPTPIPPPPPPPPAPVVPTAVPPKPTPQPTMPPLPTPMPTPATAAATLIGGIPAGLDVNPNNGRVVIADGSGSILESGASDSTSFDKPISLGNVPVDVAVDPSTGNVFVSARKESAVVVLDASGRRLASIALPAAPGDLQLDPELGLVYVVLPDRQALAVIDARGGRLLRTIDSIPQVTSLAIDSQRHTLYASQLGGQVSVVDIPSNQVTGRIAATGVGLQSVATSRGLVYAVNSASHELAVIEPISQGVIRYLLSAEPAAVTASEDSGAVYVLTSVPNAILRIDPTDGDELGRVQLGDRAARFAIQTNAGADFQGLRSRIVLNSADESVYVTQPDAGALSVVSSDLFPALERTIPWVELPETPGVQAAAGSADQAN